MCDQSWAYILYIFQLFIVNCLQKIINDIKIYDFTGNLISLAFYSIFEIENRCKMGGITIYEDSNLLTAFVRVLHQ